jgi:site-specific DNA-adenine methylase
MIFWTITNIDMWLLGGVVFNLLWAIYKAIEHDQEKLLERVRYLEDGQEEIFKKLRRKK